jgi:hypothetical protein
LTCTTPQGGPLLAPDGEQLRGRLEALASLMRAPESAPALLVAALGDAVLAGQLLG